MADRVSLQRVFNNILTNCARYSDGELHVLVKDNGTVIFSNHAQVFSDVETECLFDRFYTVNHAKGSTGLSLSISRHLMECMGGTIETAYAHGILHMILNLPMI